MIDLNPLFLFVLFSMGYVFGLLIRNPTAGKFLIFGFAGIFIYEPVKAAGLLASAVFVAGIISHHVTPSAILGVLPRLSLGGRRERPSPRADRPHKGRRKHKNAESTDETQRRYEEYQERNKAKDAKAEKASHEGNPHHRRGYTSRNPEYAKKQPERDAGASKAQDELQREKARLKREQDRLKAEREQFQREQQPPPDTRTDEEVLGVSGSFTLAELKKARNSEVKRWNTSNMRHKPPHLIAQAEEEAKRINLAYERLVKQFR